MKTKKYTYLIIAFFITSCTKDFKDLNIDPNNPSQVPTEYLLTSAEQGLSYWVTGGEYVGLILAQYWSQNNYSEESRYHFRNSSTNYWWGFHYRTPIKDLQEIIDIELKSKDAQSAKSNNKVAIASILKAFTIVHLSDVWGAMPYKEALQGNLNRTPKWDSQKDIYTQAFQ